mgnify:CR=1 FL=1
MLRALLALLSVLIVFSPLFYGLYVYDMDLASYTSPSLEGVQGALPELQELHLSPAGFEVVEADLQGGKFKAEVKLSVEIPRVLIERKPVDIRIGEDELIGRIALLAAEGVFRDGRTAGGVANELIRRCWHPKDLEHVRPALEQLVAIGILDRARERKRRGKGFKWIYREGASLPELREAWSQRPNGRP